MAVGSLSAPARGADEQIDWIKSIPFILMHLAPLGAIWTGFTWGDVVLCVALYVIRMFFITAGYHRYFSHRSYRLGRGMQFLMAFGGATAVQKGPLWWAVHHRTHHRTSDTDDDPHASHRGLWWSHVAWILCNKYDATPEDKIKDFARFPELRWLNRYHVVPPLLLAIACYAWAAPARSSSGSSCPPCSSGTARSRSTPSPTAGDGGATTRRTPARTRSCWR